MADMEFDLGEAVGGYEQAKADRDFYLNMIDMGRTNKGAFMASPIAAYLYGVSNVKMANMRAKAQNIEDQRQAQKDAIAAQEKAQQRATNIDNQIVALVKGARDGSIPASVAATMLGPLMKEKGLNLKQFDADRSVLIGNEPGDTEDFEWDLSEGLTNKGRQAQERIDLAREREARLARGAEDKAKMDAVKLQIQQKKLNDLVAGKANPNNTSAETRFLSENKGLMEVVNNPKGLMKNRPIEDRISGYVLSNKAAAKNWLRGIETLSAEAQERLGSITEQVALQARMNGLISQDEFKKYQRQAVKEEQDATASATSVLDSFFN